MLRDREPSPRADCEVFIAAPMSALDPSEYAAKRAEVLAVIEHLAKDHGISRVYFAGAAIGQPEEFTGEAEALRRDLTALRAARLFVLLYPSKTVTSALVEAGYALALRLPCLLLVRDKADLPYLLDQAERPGASDLLPPLRIAILRDPSQAAQQIAAFRDDTREAASR